MFDERKPEEFELTPDLAALQKRLAGLTPVEPRVDRDRFMFEAGRAAGSRERGAGGVHLAGAMPQAPQSRFWPVTAGLMTAATVMLSAMLAWQAKPPAQGGAVEVVVAEPRAAVADMDVSNAQAGPRWLRFGVPTSGYLGMRQAAATRGVGAIDLPMQSTGDDDNSFENWQQEQPASARELLRELVPQAKQRAHPKS